MLICFSVISSLRFDDGTLKMLMTLLRAGIIDILTKNPDQEEDPVSSGSVAGSLSATMAANDDASVSNATVSTKVAAAPGKLAKAGSMHMDQLLGRSNSQMGSLDSFQITQLKDVFFLDLNIAGWVIGLRHVKALQLLIRKGFDPTLPVESNEGNNCLHYIARFGVPDMVDCVMTDKRTRLEALNTRGQTAGMIAAKYGNIKLAKRLFEYKASPRKSLDGKYAAWVLAHVRRREKFEINTQTGRFGDDDELHSSISPDPFYITWYTL